MHVSPFLVIYQYLITDALDARLERDRSNGSALDCNGLGSTSSVCSIVARSNSVCQYIVAQCQQHTEYDGENDTTHSGRNSTVADSGSGSDNDNDRSSGDIDSSVTTDDGDGDTSEGDGDDGDTSEGDDSDISEGDDGDTGEVDDGDSSEDDGSEGDVGDTSEGDSDVSISDGDDGATSEGDGDDGDTREGDGDNGENDGVGDSDNGDGGSNDNNESESDNGGDMNDTTDSTTDIPPQTNPSSESNMISIGIFSVVAVAVFVALVSLAIVTLLIVYVRRKKKVAVAVQIEDATEHKETGGGIGEKHLDNPTYNTSLEFQPCSQAADDAERNLLNPLYDLRTEAEQRECEPHAYAILESPSYAMPGELQVSNSQTDSETATPDLFDHDYDYADTPVNTTL